MKQVHLTLAILFTLLVSAPLATQAARPNPPGIAGSVPIVMFVPDASGTNLIALPPRVQVIDEHGRTVADLETTVEGLTGTFDIKLKKAGTYVVWAYYPAPSQLVGTPRLVDVFRKQTATVSLAWPPQ